MTTVPFTARSETFGLDTDQPWGLPLIRLLFNVPRTFAPLVDAFERTTPGSRRRLDQLVANGFVAHQPGIVMDTIGQRVVDQSGRAVARYVATVRTRRLLERAREDLREIDRVFPHTTDRNRQRIFDLLGHLWLEDANRRFGISAKHATRLAGLPERSGRWWVQHLVRKGYVRRLPQKLADTREVIPAHWRPTRMFARQLLDVIDAFDQVPASLASELRLKRSRYLSDIDPARVGVGGASDYDHDIEAQRVLAALLLSDRCRRDGQFQVEPRIVLPAARDGYRLAFEPDGSQVVIYQPDAELRESGPDGQVRRSIIEYERFQSRRDAWGHIENFCGWLATMSFAFEPAVLRFVVDSDARARTYVELLEAYADHALDHPEQQPANDVLLAVATVDRVLTADDPLDDRHWHRIPLPNGGADGARVPVLHPADRSPYDLYFGRR